MCKYMQTISNKFFYRGPHDSLLAKDPKSPAKRPKLDSVDKGFEEFVHDDTDYYKRDIHYADSKMKAKDKDKPRPKLSVTIGK